MNVSVEEHDMLVKHVESCIHCQKLTEVLFIKIKEHEMILKQ